MPDACHIASTLIPLPQLYITIHQTAANHLQIAKVPFVSCSWSGCATPPLIATGAKFSREIRVVLITSAVSKKKKKKKSVLSLAGKFTRLSPIFPSLGNR